MAEEKIVSIHPGGHNGGIPRVPGEKQVSVLSGLVSIIMPCCGMLEYTKLCVASVLRHSRDPFEMIFLDIGSLDGTAEYLAGIKTAARVHVEIVRTQTDQSIPEACREALARAGGEFLVLLNNDTVVTDGWLNQLTALARTSVNLGLVGPMSNYAAPPQLVETVPYRVGPKKGTRFQGSSLAEDFLVDVHAVNNFAREFREKNQGKYLETDRLGGFCLLLKRQVLKTIESHESLEKWSDLGLFDTDILSTKARQYGFKLACCRDLFVHHFGTRTFAHGAPTADIRAKDSNRS